ncbi:MAG: penicillin-binding protein [Flavobacteriales bacterium]
MDVKKDILWRVYLTFFVMVAFALVVISQIVNLQFFQAKEIKVAAVAKIADYREVEANRGDIYSSDGSLMATSMTFYLVGMDCSSKALTDESFNENIDALCDSLSALLGGKTPNEFKRDLEHCRKIKKRWYKLHDGLTYTQFRRLKSFPLFNKGKYAGGLVYTRKIERRRPYQMASRTLGKGGDSEIGIEGAFNLYLRGENGLQYQRKIGEGIWVPIDDANSVDPVDGGDVYTTIDMKIQDIAETELLRKLRYHGAEHGCVVVMEVATGKVRAIANLKVTDTAGVGTYQEYVNYAVMERSEPGSVFKLASLLVAIEDGKIDASTLVDTKNGRVTFYDKTIVDSHGPYGIINVQRVLEVSSNVGTSILINEHYGKNPRAFVNRLYKFGLTESLNLDIEGEPKPNIKTPGGKGWSGLTLPIMSYGYDMEITPLQTLAFYNALANNGYRVKPMFVERVVQKDGSVKVFNPEVSKSPICSQKTVANAKAMLEGVVLNGTAKAIQNDKYSIAGKTGTAWFGYNGRKKDEERHYRSTFVGYFPADKPKYSIIVVVSDPRKNGYYGGEVSAPVFKAISDRIYANMIDSAKLKKATVAPLVADKLKPSAMEDEAVLSKRMAVKSVAAQKKIVTPALGDNKVPDVTGLGLKDGVFLLENMGLIVKVQGRGTIAKQSIAPGTPIIKGSEIIIELI